MAQQLNRKTTVNSLAEYIAAVNSIVLEWTPKGAQWYLQPWFRGHGDASWKLTPGLYRIDSAAGGIGEAYYNEDKLMESFKLRAPTYLESTPATDWEWLFLMQHYGLQTRLLDWTESSLIALYFALRDNPGHVDGGVWVLNPWWLNYQSFGDYVLFPADDARAGEYLQLKPEAASKTLLPIAITPVRKSSRIVAQRGVFTIQGHRAHTLDKLANQKGKAQAPLLKQILIPKKSIQKIRQDLAIAGISESIIFPELSGLCREIKMEFFGL